MSDPELQRWLADAVESESAAPGTSPREKAVADKDDERISEVFNMFKTYLEEKIDEKGKQLELKGKTEKEVVQLNYKGNQKQYKLNAKTEAILDDQES